MTSGWETKGDLWADLDAPGGLTTMSTGAAQAPGTSWANTANTVKFSGTSVGGPYSITFNVLFGPVSSGIAQSAMFSGIPDGPSACGASATMIRSGN